MRLILAAFGGLKVCFMIYWRLIELWLGASLRLKLEITLGVLFAEVGRYSEL